VEPQDYHQASYEIWEAMAPGWERRHGFIWDASRTVGEQMVEALDPQQGDTVLELAAGTGETGFAAAARVGPEGKLISTDFSPGMVEAARRRGEALGLRNAEFKVMDAEKMDLDDDSVDGVLCRWGYMLMADPATALSETRRVLRDGGRVSFAVVGGPERNPWATIPGRVLVERGHMPPPEEGAPGIFAMADENRIRALVTGAGFGEPKVEPVEMRWQFEDAEDYWGFTTEIAGGLAMVIAELPEDEQRSVREEVEGRIEPLRSNGDYDMEGLTLNVLAS
jgi:SAM-dependent methyltransferase